MAPDNFLGSNGKKFLNPTKPEGLVSHTIVVQFHKFVPKPLQSMIL